MSALIEIYNEALGEVSPGTDLPSPDFASATDPEMAIAKVAFRNTCNKLTAFINWSFLQNKVVLSSETEGYQAFAETITDFDPLYGYRWDVSPDLFPGFGRFAGLLVDRFDLVAGDELNWTSPNFRSYYERYLGNSVFGGFRFRDKKLYTNANPCLALYIQKVGTGEADDMTGGVPIEDIPVHFRTALVAGMAAYLAMSQKSSLQMRAYLQTQFRNAEYRAYSIEKISYREGRVDYGGY